MPLLWEQKLHPGYLTGLKMTLLFWVVYFATRIHALSPNVQKPWILLLSQVNRGTSSTQRCSWMPHSPGFCTENKRKGRSCPLVFANSYFISADGSIAPLSSKCQNLLRLIYLLYKRHIYSRGSWLILTDCPQMPRYNTEIWWASFEVSPGNTPFSWKTVTSRRCVPYLYPKLEPPWIASDHQMIIKWWHDSYMLSAGNGRKVYFIWTTQH